MRPGRTRDRSAVVRAAGRPTLAGLVLGLLLLWPCTAGASIRLHPAGSQLDLLMMGFGVFRSGVSHEDEPIFRSRDGLPGLFTNRQLLNLRLEGLVARQVALEARVQYDRESFRSWRYRFQLAHEKARMSFGEQEGAFRDTEFTRYGTSFYGAEAGVALGGFSTNAFWTAQEGSYRVDRLRATGLSGPFILSASPVLEGSEAVAIEVRDWRDPERLLRSDRRQRGLDYSIDHATGTILFNTPIEPETFEGNPVFVVVEYRFLVPDGSGNDTLSGVRLGYRPTEGLRLGTTYLSSSGRGDSVLEQEGIWGLDQSLALGRWLELRNEMAGPAGRLLDPLQSAWKLAVRVRPNERLEVGARYRRVGKEFETLANPSLDTDRDRQVAELDLSFLLKPAQRVTLGMNWKSDNVAGSDQVSTSHTRHFYMGWQGTIPGGPALGVLFERRWNDGPGSFAGSSEESALTCDLEHELGAPSLLGPTSLRAQYRFETFGESGTDAGESRQTHSARMRLTAHPRQGLSCHLGLQTTRTRELISGAATTADELFVGAEYAGGQTLSFGTSLRFRRNDSDTAAASQRWSALLSLAYRPSRHFRGELNYEVALSSKGESEDRFGQNLFVRASLIPLDNLTASLGYKLDDREEQLGSSAPSDGEYFASVQYKLGGLHTLFLKAERGFSSERLPPFEPTLSRRSVWLTGIDVVLSERWSVQGQFKDERLSGDVEAHRSALLFELSRSLSRYLRVATGVELTLEEQDLEDRLDSRSLYLKLVGRL